LKLYAVFILLFLFSLPAFAQRNIKIYGLVTDGQTNQPLINANIIADSSGAGTASDKDGYYSLYLPANKDYRITFSYVGYESRVVLIYTSPGKKNYEQNIALLPAVIKQEDVNIIGDKYPNSTLVREVEGENIRKMPTILSDVMRSIKILPGVVSNDELSTGYNVRGGNYDQNLIYLNGFEIYRPFLVREGLEENQSLLNPSLVKVIKFFGAAFPSAFGDKLSSALEVEYWIPDKPEYKASLGADLLQAEISGSGMFNRLSIISGIRYSYPSLFGNRLQRKGNYNPAYFDVQILSGYKLTNRSSLQLLLISAHNNYDLKPDNWKGHFLGGLYDVKEVGIYFNGYRKSNFNTGLYGLKYQNRISDELFVYLSASYLTNYEKERTDLTEDIIYSESAYNPEENKLFLKNRFEYVNNSLDLSQFEIKPQVVYKNGPHLFESGLQFRLNKFSNSLYENVYETGPDSTLELPYFRTGKESYNFNYTAFYLQDNISISKLFAIDAGLRVFHYGYNKEFKASPRFSLYFFPSEKHTINFSTGYYYQPPFVYELRNNPAAEYGLNSQKSLHLLLGWDYRKSVKDRFQFEVFYKKNSDMIPFNIENMQIQYYGGNELKGFAYGFDFQYTGEIVDGMKSWIGYSYLNAKERPENNILPYRRSLLDQRHTIKIFLQDKIRKHPNFQSHVRLMFGTGMLYHPKIILADEETGMTYLAVDYNSINVLPFYFRVDMGLSYKFDLKENTSITLIAEVLNVFDKNNIADYKFYTIHPLTRYPISVPQIFTKRFFNIGVKMNL